MGRTFWVPWVDWVIPMAYSMLPALPGLTGGAVSCRHFVKIGGIAAGDLTHSGVPVIAGVMLFRTWNTQRGCCRVGSCNSRPSSSSSYCQDWVLYCPLPAPRKRRRKKRSLRGGCKKRWCNGRRIRGGKESFSRAQLIRPPSRAMSVPGRRGSQMSATAAVRVRRGSTLMSLAPLARALSIQRMDMGWFSAVLTPWSDDVGMLVIYPVVGHCSSAE